MERPVTLINYIDPHGRIILKFDRDICWFKMDQEAAGVLGELLMNYSKLEDPVPVPQRGVTGGNGAKLTLVPKEKESANDR